MIKNSIKTYRCHKNNSIKVGDYVYIDKDGYVYKRIGKKGGYLVLDIIDKEVKDDDKQEK